MTVVMTRVVITRPVAIPFDLDRVFRRSWIGDPVTHPLL
jgi:hypothetical protein